MARVISWLLHDHAAAHLLFIFVPTYSYHIIAVAILIISFCIIVAVIDWFVRRFVNATIWTVIALFFALNFHLITSSTFFFMTSNSITHTHGFTSQP